MLFTILEYLQNIFNNLFSIFFEANPHQSIAQEIDEKTNKVSNKKTTHHVASKRNDTERAKFLVEKGFGHRFLLYRAVIKGDTETVSLLIEKGADIDAKTPKGLTLLYIAARSKKYNVLELLIQKGANVNELCPNESALFVAANNGDEKLAKMLIENNADINIKTAINGFTPLFWAAISDHKNVVNLLVEYGADVNAKDNVLLETA